MKAIMEFNGTKKISLLEKRDYALMKETLPNDDYREIPIFTKSDFERAEKAGCHIYLKSYEFQGCKVERFFIKISKEKLFENAEKPFPLACE